MVFGSLRVVSARVATQELDAEEADGAPTVALASAVADAIAQRVPSVRRICLYGSVARGEARPDSDIDLLVVFDDIDYVERKRIAGRCRGAADAAPSSAGRRINIIATDTAEWEIRSNLKTSFERAISADLMELHRSEEPIRRSDGSHKMTDKPVSRLDEAYATLKSIHIAYERANTAFLPQPEELDLQRTDPYDQLSWYQYARYLTVVTNIDMVLETSLKTLHHLVGDDPPAWSHKLAVLIDELPDSIETDKAVQALSALRVDRLPPSAYDEHDLKEVFTNWRVHGTYDATGLASDYLPTERVEAYLNAADQISDILMDALRSRTPEGALKDTPDVYRYLAAVRKMRRLRHDHDLATGHRLHL